jgi:transposase
MERQGQSVPEVKDAAETEGARRATGVSAGGDPHPDPEVPAKAKRRQFSAEYRMRILREADACKASGELGALLRREGLYSSHLVLWRRQRETGALAGMRARKRGPKAKVQDPRVKQLEKENARLQRQLKQAETIIDIQKKVASILGIPLNAPELDEND